MLNSSERATRWTSTIAPTVVWGLKVVEDSWGSSIPKDGQAEYGSRMIDHHANVAEHGPRDEDVVEHVGEDTIANLEMASSYTAIGPTVRTVTGLALTAMLKVGGTLVPPSYQSNTIVLGPQNPSDA